MSSNIYKKKCFNIGGVPTYTWRAVEKFSRIVKLKTKEQLLAEGWEEKYELVYSRNGRTFRYRKSGFDLLGKVVRIVSLVTPFTRDKEMDYWNVDELNYTMITGNMVEKEMGFGAE